MKSSIETLYLIPFLIKDAFENQRKQIQYAMKQTFYTFEMLTKLISLVTDQQSLHRKKYFMTLRKTYFFYIHKIVFI